MSGDYKGAVESETFFRSIITGDGFELWFSISKKMNIKIFESHEQKILDYTTKPS